MTPVDYERFEAENSLGDVPAPVEQRPSLEVVDGRQRRAGSSSRDRRAQRIESTVPERVEEQHEPDGEASQRRDRVPTPALQGRRRNRGRGSLGGADPVATSATPGFDMNRKVLASAD